MEWHQLYSSFYNEDNGNHEASYEMEPALIAMIDAAQPLTDEETATLDDTIRTCERCGRTYDFKSRGSFEDAIHLCLACRPIVYNRLNGLERAGNICVIERHLMKYLLFPGLHDTTARRDKK